MTTRNAPSQTVSFRVQSSVYSILAELAERKHLSPGELSRELVTESLNGEQRSELLDALKSVQEEVEQLRSDLGWLLANVLVTLGGQDEDAVRKLVARRFPPTGGT